MIYYLFGEDSFLRNRKLKEILDTYKTKNKNVDLLILDFEEDENNYLVAKDFLAQPSMFVEKKVLVIKQNFVLADKNWLKFLSKFIDDQNVFIIISDSKAPVGDFKNFFKKIKNFQEFKELEGDRLKKFILFEIKKRDLKFSKEALIYFYNYIRNFSLRSSLVVNELDKLSFLKEEITLNLLKELLNWVEPLNVKEVNKVLSKNINIKQKIYFLEKLFFQKSEPAYIFNSLVYYLSHNNLLKFSDYDFLIKKGLLDYELALLDFILS